ncbi:NAD(P)-dependent oxidoreductase [Isoptericola halotolerans]|uniref:NAD-dependent epimerase/dehydratase family protein n=1 Tax=Isoptericola halotolerans TaxID=300560 RepID=UPI0038908FDC
MRAVVVGSTGFVGGHVRTGLARRGWHVAALDRSSLPDGDIVRALAGMIAVSPPDLVVNCTGATSGSRTALYRSNADLARDLACAVAAAGRRPRLVHIGSAAEYGAASGSRPCAEVDEAIPLTDYGRSKLEGTRRVLAAVPSATVLRATTVIGAGCGGFVGAVCRQIAAGAPDGTVAVGSLAAARDLVDVDDLVAAVDSVARAPAVHGGIYNVGTGVAVELDLVVARVRAVTGFRGRVVTGRVPGSGRSAAVVSQCSDIGKIARDVGWAPVTPLDASIRAVWDQACASTRTHVDRGGRACPSHSSPVPTAGSAVPPRSGWPTAATTSSSPHGG